MFYDFVKKVTALEVKIASQNTGIESQNSSGQADNILSQSRNRRGYLHICPLKLRSSKFILFKWILFEERDRETNWKPSTRRRASEINVGLTVTTTECAFVRQQ